MNRMDNSDPRTPLIPKSCNNCDHGNNYIDCKNPERKSGISDFRCHSNGSGIQQEKSAIKISNELWPDKQEPQDEIREAFEKSINYKLTIEESEMLNNIKSVMNRKNLYYQPLCLIGFYDGLKTATEKAQEEIEELEETIAIQKEDLENTRILCKEKDKQIESMRGIINNTVNDIIFMQQEDCPNSEILTQILNKIDNWQLKN